MQRPPILTADLDNFLSQCKSFDYLDSAIFVIDKGLHILYQNPAFQSLSDRFYPGATNKTVLLMEHAQVFNMAIQTLVREKTGQRVEIELPFNREINIPVTFLCHPVFGPEKEILCCMISLEDESLTLTLRHKAKQQATHLASVQRIESLTEENLEQKAMIKSVMDKSPIGMMIIDANQQLLQINASACQIFQTEKNSSLGKHCSQFFNCHELHAMCPVIHGSQELHEEETVTYHLKPRDKILLKSSTRISVRNQPAVLEAFIDISDKKEFERELLDAVIATERANTAKDEFLANMSHELRTPLHAILSFSQLGQKPGKTEEKRQDYFRKIQHSGKTLMNLLNNLLDLSKLESGKVKLALQDTDLNLLINSVIDELQDRFSEKHIDLQLSLQNKLPPVSCDAEKIKQVIHNLVDNALKFTPSAGNILIATEKQAGKVLFRIENNGPEIPDDEREHIFAKFTQSSKTNTGAGGTGLGLAISKDILQLHHGDIWAEKSRIGAQFIFYLPIS